MKTIENKSSRNTEKAVLILMRGNDFPENGILSAESMNEIARQKSEGNKVILCTDRSMQEMEQGNLTTAPWDAAIVLDGKAVCSEYGLKIGPRRPMRGTRECLDVLEKYWDLKIDQLEASVLAD